MSKPPNDYRKENYCPYCNHHMDAACMPGDETAKPTPGALSVCIKCTKVSVFDDLMNIIPFDINTLDQEDHAHVIKMQYIIHGSQGHYQKKH